MASGDALTHASALRQALTARSIALLREEDFDRAQELTQLAREVKELEARVQRVLGMGPASVLSSPRSVEDRPPSDGAYPQFHREGDFLVKVALSRNLKTTYEQRCPRAVYEEVLAAVENEAPKGVTFEASQIKSRVTCPDYQVYLVLALLEKLGYLEVPRRGLHRLPQEIGADWADQIWQTIPRGAAQAA